MRRTIVAAVFLFSLLPFTLAISQLEPAVQKPQITPTPGVVPSFEPDQLEQVTEVEKQVQEAILAAVAAERENVLAYLAYDIQTQIITISQDSSWAKAYLALTDPETGEVLPTEPGLAFAIRNGSQWQAILPSHSDWESTLRNAPIDLISEEDKAGWLELFEEQAANVPSAPLSGYLLPWAEGKVVNLSQSVGHDKYTPSGNAHFSWDFYVHRTMWDIYAAREGTVWLIKDDINTDDNTVPIGNYLVLQDTTTSPVTYQLYLHLAQDSIPPSLRVKGAPVIQGQFIGVADNTGNSTGHHLHYQVHTNPLSYWGQAVDVIFDDVDINGGRPRAPYYDPPYCGPDDVCQVFRSSYVSRNRVKGDLTAPVGDLTTIANGQVVGQSTVLLKGWGTDNESGFYSGQFVAEYGGAWHDISPVFYTPSFEYNWNLCASGVSDGVVSVAVHLRDMDGNRARRAGLSHFTKKFTCAPPPPACTVGPAQVALFKEPNYQGACTVYAAGDYADGSVLGAVGDNGASSIRIGEGIRATLFMDAGYSGRGETFFSSDSNLADNRVGAKTVSSMKVQAANTAPAIPALIWPADGKNFTTADSLFLSWEDQGGAQEFQVKLGAITTDWLSQTYWNLANLPAGSYSWQVRARNSAGTSNWSPPHSLAIQSQALSGGSTVTAPFIDSVESEIDSNGWTTSGLWKRSTVPFPASSGSYYWWFGQSDSGDEHYITGKYGDLTSRPIAIPGPGYYLRFWYRYQTETQGKHWDQRWVQISVDGGPFSNLVQLSDDPMNYWLRSLAINLSAYAGKTIRVRFHFDTVDLALNDYAGWSIDDVEITNAPVPACSDSNEPNDTAMQAVPLSYGQTMTAQICPGGDIDFYSFTGVAGDKVVADIDAQSEGSELDAVIYLLDSDGSSVLAKHDDEEPYSRYDPHLGYELPRSGQYYLKVQAWDNPGEGGPESFYRLKLTTDSEDPTARLVYPVSNVPVASGKITLQASAVDSGSGISHVEFLWHSGDWLNSKWEVLGADRDGSDGWSLEFDASSLVAQKDIAFYIKAYDWAGNWDGSGAYNISFDYKPLFIPLVRR